MEIDIHVKFYQKCKVCTTICYNFTLELWPNVVMTCCLKMKIKMAEFREPPTVSAQNAWNTVNIILLTLEKPVAEGAEGVQFHLNFCQRCDSSSLLKNLLQFHP